jgi:hypothetical protein
MSTVYDMGGLTLRVNALEIGASSPGVAGTNLATSFTAGTLKGSVQSLSGAGAVNLTTLITEVTSTGANALTLADGTSGQVKIITMIVDGGDATLTPTTLAGAATTITFNDVGDTVILVYTDTLGWVIASNNGATVA